MATVSYRFGMQAALSSSIEPLRIVNAGAFGLLLALILDRRGFTRPLHVIEQHAKGLNGSLEPFFQDELSPDQLELVDPAIVKEWPCSAIFTDRGSSQDCRSIALLSFEQLVVEARERLPRANLLLDGTDPRPPRERDADGGELATVVGRPQGWVRSSTWEVTEDHGLRLPVLDDPTISGRSVLQY